MPIAAVTSVMRCLLFALLAYASRASRPLHGRHPQHEPDPSRMLNATSYGYLKVNDTLGSKMFYMYYEAREPVMPLEETPIILWLQGGPGCSSLFGMLYINGPYTLTPELILQLNPHSWSTKFGMLFIEQPIAVGFSVAGEQTIPDNEMQLAVDLYQALQDFYRQHKGFARRPLYITGESYAGKYVPSISHFIVQMTAAEQGQLDKLKRPRIIPPGLQPPRFKLGGVAIGNGWVDARSQLEGMADVAWNMGLIDAAQRREVQALQQQTIDLLDSKKYRQARRMSDVVEAYIVNVSGTATLEDIRRDTGYDGDARVDRFLNLPEVKRQLRISSKAEWISCSPEVDDRMGHDVMKSVKHLVPDILQFHQLLIYLGQFDAECGVAQNDAWMSSLQWNGHNGYLKAPRVLWQLDGEVTGFYKAYGPLAQLVVRNAGHMVPHDRPKVAQVMIEGWVMETLGKTAQDWPPRAQKGNRGSSSSSSSSSLLGSTRNHNSGRVVAADVQQGPSSSTAGPFQAAV